jgi:hypothetical protein
VPPSPGQPVSTLRGARVEVDARRAGRVAVVLVLVALGATALFLLVGGMQKNAQVTQLHNDGVPVEVTVSDCRGLLGGSGSNPVGYTCSGSFTWAGHRYTESIPGDSLFSPGSRLRMVTIASNPGLLAAPGVVATERSSARVFIFPAVLFGVVALGTGAVVFRRRRAQPALRSLPGLGGGRRLGEAVGGV